MKKFLVLLAIVMAMLFVVPLAASPSAIDPAMSLDTMAEAGAVISAAAAAEAIRTPAWLEAISPIAIVVLLDAVLIGAALLLRHILDARQRPGETKVH